MKEFLDFADAQENLGCLGVRFHDLHGNFLPECKRSVPDVFNSFEKLFSPFQSKQSSKKNYYRNDIAETEIAPVEVITGAFLLMKRELYLEMGFFDEYYFFCPEDIALSTALNRRGYFCYVNASVELIHYEGCSGKTHISQIKTVE
jgi:GT2 family glycosyltransferase